MKDSVVSLTIYLRSVWARLTTLHNRLIIYSLKGGAEPIFSQTLTILEDLNGADILNRCRNCAAAR